MIYVNSATKQDFIIETLEAITGDITYKFSKKIGIKLAFEISSDDVDTAITLAKSTIKATELGSVLYFQVSK